MEIILYGIIFIIGILIGSFCTLAVYRIPLGKDITHERSFCPNCNHRLEFWDLIPIVSYLALGGKCRYCKEKIRIRYLLLEIASGIIFLLLALSMNIHLENILINAEETIHGIVLLGFGILYFTTLILIAGIDKERTEIAKPVLLFGLIILGAYILYLYMVKNIPVYKYVIYLIFMLIIILLDICLMKKKKKENYTISILLLWIYMLAFTNTDVMLFTIIATLIFIAIHSIAHKLETKGKENIKVPIGFYMVISNIFFTILANFLAR